MHFGRTKLWVSVRLVNKGGTKMKLQPFRDKIVELDQQMLSPHELNILVAFIYNQKHYDIVI